MKKFLLATLIALCGVIAKADNIVIPVTAGVVSNLFTVGVIIDNITATATSTNITTFKFRDSSNTTTTYVAAAYSHYAHYSTNFSTVFTNEAGLLVTNSFRGVWTYPTSVSASTNSIPVWSTIVVPASSTRSKDINGATMRGLNVIADQAGIVEVDYRPNP